jgi:hypothetical protein
MQTTSPSAFTTTQPEVASQIAPLPISTTPSVVPTAVVNGPDFNSPNGLNSLDPNSPTDSNPPTWPVPSIAEQYCRPTFGERLRCDAGDLWHETVHDYGNYYSWKSLGVLGIGFGIGAIGANTEIDQRIRNWYQRDVRSTTSDDIAKIAKKFGEGGYEVPAAAAAWLVGEAFNENRYCGAIGDWGDRELRSLFVGTPPMLAMQYVTGASRPGETSAESHWKPFTDNNGVSGHAFMGALPFINAAKMTDEVPLKVGLYACSGFAAWSRVNDDAHYTSQIFLGWWMAWWAATCVDTTDQGPHDWLITPLPMADGAGVAISYQY